MHSTNAFKYSRPRIALHWLMFFLLVMVYAAIELRVFFDKGTPERDFMKSLHFMFGLTVLLLVLVRLLARRFSSAPPNLPLEEFFKHMHRASQLGHWALYAFMLLMPLMGWMVLSAAGKPTPFFCLALPALITPDEALAKQLKEWHETAGLFGYALIGLHTVAAFFHQFVLQDNLMASMRMR